MRYRISGLAFRRSVAAAALVAGAVSLAGCSSLGGSNFIDPSVTGSTGHTVGAAATTQSMPAPLVSQPVGRGPYTPPADIGQQNPVAPVITSGVAQTPAVQARTMTVKSQPLPPLLSSGSEKSMPAQTTTQVASASVPTPAELTAPRALVSPAKPATAAGETGPVHVIASGESLYVIARKYGVSPDTIVKANGLASMDKIFVGQKLVIPGGKLKADTTTTASVSAPVKSTSMSAPAPQVIKPVTVASVAPAAAVENPVKPAAAGGKFRWPVSGTVIVNFAESRSGINIAAQEGTAVRAAESGTVIYTGSAVQGYGNLILIKHDNGYVSAYAHLKDITVAKGETVGRGDAIGTTGMTGGVSRPQLHFELRKGATPVDPMPLLAG